METQTIVSKLYKALERSIEMENEIVSEEENNKRFSVAVKQIVISDILRNLYMTFQNFPNGYLKPTVFYALEKFCEDDDLQIKYLGLPEHILKDIINRSRDLNHDMIESEFYPLIRMLRDLCNEKNTNDKWIEQIDEWLDINRPDPITKFANKKLTSECDQLKEKIKQLENEIIELKFRPGGEGYRETKGHFEQFSKEEAE